MTLSVKPSNIILKDKVISLWNLGDTSGEIAEQLGMTRSAVMGVVHRAKKKGLIQRAFVVNEPVLPKAPKAPKKKAEFFFHQPKKSMALPPTPVEAVLKNADYPGAKDIMEIGFNECRFVVAQGMFCAKPSGKHPSWCSEHHGLVFTERRGPLRHAEVLMHKMKFNF
jgi:hypothetical protein